MALPSVSNLPLSDLIAYIRGMMPGYNNNGLSGEDLQAMVQANTQQNIAGVNAASQLAQSNQTNAMRMMELFGADASGNATDAAQRWRNELYAQQAVQNERLRQEQMQMLGYNPAAASQTTLEARNQQAQQAQRWAEITGQAIDPTTGQPIAGGTTLEARRLAQDAEQA
jgi:hypothetical protein